MAVVRGPVSSQPLPGGEPRREQLGLRETVTVVVVVTSVLRESSREFQFGIEDEGGRDVLDVRHEQEGHVLDTTAGPGLKGSKNQI